jgi:chemotaxis protein MotB
MFALTQRRRQSVNIWPGFVDGLASVLMVLIFTLLIFVLAQFFLSNQLSGRDRALTQLSRGINELADALSLEKEKTANLAHTVKQLDARLTATISERDSLLQRLTLLTQRAESAESQSARLQQSLE